MYLLESRSIRKFRTRQIQLNCFCPEVGWKIECGEQASWICCSKDVAGCLVRPERGNDAHRKRYKRHPPSQLASPRDQRDVPEILRVGMVAEARRRRVLEMCGKYP